METEAKTALTPLEEEMLAALHEIARGWPGTEASRIAIHAIAKAQFLKAQAAQAENAEPQS